MTQENKELLLRDLCCRLPYGVKVFINNKIEILEGLGILDNVAEYGSFLSCDIEEVKPYLFPLSSMTEEQIKEALSTKHKINLSSGKVMYLDSLKTFEFYDKNHIDYRGLIPKGLATDATNLNIY